MIKDDIIIFGAYKWQVLDVKDARTLIITDTIIALSWYHNDFVDVTWADCRLRNYLNNEFYNTFSSNEKAKIIAVTNANTDNQWFKTKGGVDTNDNLFFIKSRRGLRLFW